MEELKWKKSIQFGGYKATMAPRRGSFTDKIQKKEKKNKPLLIHKPNVVQKWTTGSRGW